MRKADVERNTKETRIKCEVNLDGRGDAVVDTGIGFFDHMLTLFSFHSKIDLKMVAHGDLNVDDHHTVEDCGIVLGEAVRKALGNKIGIERYGSFNCPMDETLANVTLDISGRPYLVYHCDLTRDTVGTFSCEMTEEFLRAFAVAAGITLHVNVYYGTNDHHKIEAIFKALGHAMKQAVKVTGDTVSSSKGVLV
ncbi:imidazoleglycerol-phosphate dehydratase HisB [Catenisphaera adipataccumulans]|jgi:imidazoleglycerol phosphate dehydratase HisB|uniref:Imidazoleglycerol-phosphate dehydratase n=1 Tax=Catenisphaera adipataccumulans TaxID=700500 RepID=A0A7W8FWV1_9FIRM|nr:imidazoleglycerol-phosphate dehydratase HisB [Catenisphaera adipataccumulans]MBB5182332.1 imidazoleglycerol-phosphate dehydratase [Catenisphaera adipataccumulans]